MRIVETQISRPGDIPYTLSIKMCGSIWKLHWHGLIITAPIVGTDGAIYDEKVSNVFGDIKVLKNSVHLSWHNNYLQQLQWYRRIGRMGRGVEVIVPKHPSMNMLSVRKSLSKIADRLGFVLCPQNPNLFRGKPARDFCLEIHKLVVVQEVMNS